MMGVALAFYGGLSGLLVMVFEEETARKACHVLLENGENADRSDLMDALGEFVNIIGGKFVQHMQKKHCKLEITMPRTFVKVSDIFVNSKEKKGAQVDFTVEGKPLTLFLTR